MALAVAFTGCQGSDPDEPEKPKEVKVTGISLDKTGIEMEALTAASVAALTVYDMCKAVDRGMRIDETLLLHKTGGKSGDYHAEGAAA